MNTEANMPILRSVATAQEAVKPEPVQKVNSQNQDNQVKSEDQEEKLNSQEVTTVVAELNVLAQNMQRELMFSVDDKSGDTIIKVLDKETDEVVREIPSKELRDLKARLEETAGIIFKDSV